MVLLPSLILCAEVEGPRVLEVRGQDNGLVAGLAGKLHTKVPGIERDEDKVTILRRQVLIGESIESADGVSKGSSIPNVLPSQSCQARW